MYNLENTHIWINKNFPKLSDMIALESIYSANHFTARRKIKNQYFCADCYKEISEKDKICPYCHKIIIEDI